MTQIFHSLAVPCSIFGLFLLLFLSVKIINTSSLTNSVIIANIFSLSAVFLYNIMRAPDVAITEVAVGAAISTIIYFLSFTIIRPMSHIKISKSQVNQGINQNILSFFISVSFALCSMIIAKHLPNFGDATSIVNTGVAMEYIKHAAHDFHAKNIVTAVLGGYRALDTLFETTVIFCAAMGAKAILTQEDQD